MSLVAQDTGLARSTIDAGLRDLRILRGNARRLRIRDAGGGRSLLTTVDPTLLEALAALIEPTTRGDPESLLRWTCKSPSQLADELTRQQHPLIPRIVATLLKGEGRSLQANRKTREGTSHPDRDAQFRYLTRCVIWCLGRGVAAISVNPGSGKRFPTASTTWRIARGGSAWIDHDTAEFAVNAIRACRSRIGRHRFAVPAPS